MTLQARWVRSFRSQYVYVIGEIAFGHVSVNRRKGTPFASEIPNNRLRTHEQHKTLDQAVMRVQIEVDEWFAKLSPLIVVAHADEDPQLSEEDAL